HPGRGVGAVPLRSDPRQRQGRSGVHRARSELPGCQRLASGSAAGSADCRGSGGCVMNRPVSSADSYRDELARLARALTGEKTLLRAQDRSRRDAMLLFAEENVDKRLDKLRIQLEFVAEGFTGFDKLLRAYLRVEPQRAYDSVASDAERFLVWLEQTRELSDGQR